MNRTIEIIIGTTGEIQIDSVNGSGGSGGASGGTLNNCIVYYNTNAFMFPFADNYANTRMSYCCTVPLPGGSGNFTNAPLFVNLAGADLHLQVSSPCLNAGKNAYATNSIDFDGNPRIKGGAVDVGAYELQDPSSTISYAWLQQYGLPTDGTADVADPDGDGMNNWQEWIAGTNPTNGLSVLKLLAPFNDGAGVTVSWQSVTGKKYYLQRNVNLLLPPAFSSIQSNIVGQAGTTSFTDTNATGAGPYFYRVGVQQ